MSKSLLVSNPDKAQVILVVDIANLSWKCYHSPLAKYLSCKDYPSYMQHIALDKIALCLDFIFSNYRDEKVCLVYSKDEYTNNKKELFPEYKSNRIKKVKTYKIETEDGIVEKEMNPVEDTSKALSYLPHCDLSIPTKDAETDDIIATFCRNHKDKVIYIESADRDMWQLRSKKRHIIFSENPFTILTETDVFYSFYNRDNRLIPVIKTFLGDKSDNLEGMSYVTEEFISSLSYENYKGKIKKILNHIIDECEDSKICKSVRENFERLVKLHSIIKLNKHLSIKEEYVKGRYSSFLKFLEKRKIEQPKILKLWI